LIFFCFSKFVLAQSPYPSVVPIVGINKVVFGFLPDYVSGFDLNNLKYLTHIVDWDVLVKANGTIDASSSSLPTSVLYNKNKGARLEFPRKNGHLR
jgi:hypothetical protein